MIETNIVYIARNRVSIMNVVVNTGRKASVHFLKSSQFCLMSHPCLESTLLILISGVGALCLIRNNYYSTIQAYTSGIVEIYYSNTWGNICDDSYFGYNEANVICHQLAFTGVSSYGNAGSTTL